MRRREFLGALGSASLAWPLAARAQQHVPVVGFLHGGSPEPNAHLVAAFLRGLEDSGFRERHDVVVEYRWAEGKYDRLQQLASDLVSRHVAVLYTAGGSVAAIEARKVSVDTSAYRRKADSLCSLRVIPSLPPSRPLMEANPFWGICDHSAFCQHRRRRQKRCGRCRRTA